MFYWVLKILFGWFVKLVWIKKVEAICKDLELDVLKDEDFYKFCTELNNRPGFTFDSGFTFDLNKENFADI